MGIIYVFILICLILFKLKLRIIESFLDKIFFRSSSIDKGVKLTHLSYFMLFLLPIINFDAYLYKTI